MTSNSSDALLSAHSFFSHCYSSSLGVFTSVTAANILLVLPLSAMVIRLGHQRWRQQPSAPAAPADFITYHMVVLETIYVLASVVYCVGLYTYCSILMLRLVSHVILTCACGQMSFHTLTCVERYLAVVHPVAYMRLGKSSRVRVRNVLVWCVWLMGFAELGMMAQRSNDAILLVYFTQQAFSLAAVSFCSLAVLKVLKRPGPQEHNGTRESVDQSKQRAFNTIMAIAGALLLRFGGCLVCNVVYTTSQLSLDDRCAVLELSFWFCLPSSLVLPLLFLNRAGKLQCCRNKSESGQGSS